MTPSSLRDEVLAHYFDDEQLVTVDRDPTHWSSGNGPLATGQFYLMLVARREAEWTDVARFCEAMNGITVENGLYSRNESRPDLNSHDNYIGIAAASALLNTKHRYDIYSWGKRHFWTFDNTRSSWLSRTKLSSWHGRHLGVVPFYKLCAGDDLGFFEELALSARILLDAHTCRSGHANVSSEAISGHCLTWTMIQVCKAKGVCESAISTWEEHIRGAHGCMAIVFGEYYRYSHPFFTQNYQRS